MARKPSGQRAEFKVTLDGGLPYRFDQYEGKACRKDIDQVIPKLQAIYGIRLSNESGVVETPDRLSDTARPLGFETKEQHHEH
jgi:hypothetical protein